MKPRPLVPVYVWKPEIFLGDCLLVHTYQMSTVTKNRTFQKRLGNGVVSRSRFKMADRRIAFVSLLLRPNSLSWDQPSFIKYTFCRSLPGNIVSLTPTSYLLMPKYIHFIQSTFTCVNTQLFASKGILQCQQTTINTVLLYIRDNKISIIQDISLA